MTTPPNNRTLCFGETVLIFILSLKVWGKQTREACTIGTFQLILECSLLLRIGDHLHLHLTQPPLEGYNLEKAGIWRGRLSEIAAYHAWWGMKLGKNWELTFAWVISEESQCLIQYQNITNSSDCLCFWKSTIFIEKFKYIIENESKKSWKSKKNNSKKQHCKGTRLNK